MPNPIQIDSLNLLNHTIIASGNSLWVNGVIAAQQFISGVAPSTTSLNIPVSIGTYGGLNLLMGNPAGWFNFTMSGINYKMPYYQ